MFTLEVKEEIQSPWRVESESHSIADNFHAVSISQQTYVQPQPAEIFVTLMIHFQIHCTRRSYGGNNAKCDFRPF